ncbi:Protein trichome birefringence-like 16 [Zea mays]|uniref:Protein trichome birefringence-like 16 n=3 Tax=Zea mays TaxID=4577 RepID=A0A1D6JSU2_MAIZE|nr:Protein trichome birefringence-like 16 [Zea mays]PWZ18081.1 Protein trichome birefringence-like 16 [Zea mays]
MVGPGSVAAAPHDRDPEAAAQSMLSLAKKERSASALLPNKKECEYRNGKWVSNNRRPLYSGFGCKQWLSESWSCKLTQRKDFSYEKFRWLPEACEMLEFEVSQFLRRMQDKIIAYMGDSQGRQMFQSMMCMVTGGKERLDVEDVGADYGFVLAPGAKKSRWLGLPVPEHQHNNYIPLNPGKLRANRWEMYLGGAPNNDRNTAVIWKAKNFTVHSVVRWVDAQLPRRPKMKAFYRSISPRHFFNGDWDTRGSCDNTSQGGSGVQLDRSEDADAKGAVRGTRVRLLDLTALSRLRDEGHISRYNVKATPGVLDCLHWCLSCVPDT